MITYSLPQFPDPVNTEYASKHPKLDPATLESYYDLLTAVGCFVVAKQRYKKVPVGYWSDYTPNNYDRARAMDFQFNTDTQKIPEAAGWCVLTGFGRKVVVDFDTQAIIDGGRDPVEVYNEFQALSPTGFVLGTPANGAHLYYELPAGWEMLTNANTPNIAGIDVRGQGGQVVSLGGFNYYPVGGSKGVPDGHVGAYEMVVDGDYSHIPLMSKALYERLSEGHKVTNQTGKDKGQPTQTDLEWEALARGIDPDFVPVAFYNTDPKIAEILDLLQFAVRLWSGETKPSHSHWFSLISAAHYASMGSDVVRDYIFNEPLFWQWNDNSNFDFEWNSIMDNNANPTTIATLRHIAKKGGWGVHSQFRNFRVDDDFSDFKGFRLGEINLLRAQTGSGKTELAIAQAEGFEPKEVLYISPFTALCYNLNGKAENTALYKDKTDSKLGLVATLQFLSRVDTNRFKLIVIDEIHELVKHLCTKSHMKLEEKVRGIKTLRTLLTSGATIIGTDAGINCNTIDFIEGLSGKKAHVIVNDYVRPKSAVEVITYEEALDRLQKAAGHVVAACDTMKATTELPAYHTGNNISFNHEAKEDKAHRDFYRDVEKGARDFDGVFYNSAMGQGVSIKGTTPDLLIQFSKYLSASSNIQILNRYRSQPEKVYLVYEMKKRKRIDLKGARRMIDAKWKAELDAMAQISDVSNLREKKSETALMLTEFAARFIVEENEQFIAPFAFYKYVLKKDGREVIGNPHKVETKRALGSVTKAMKENALETWRDAKEHNEGEDNELSQSEMAQAMVKQAVENTWLKIPPKDLFPEREYGETAVRLEYPINDIERMLSENPQFNRSLLTIGGSDVSTADVSQQATLYLVLSACAYLMPDLEAKLTHEHLVKSGGAFLAMIERIFPQYKAVTGRTEVGEPIKVLRSILFRVGLRLEAKARRAGGRDTRQKLKDENGNVITDYVIADVDHLRAILTSRAEARGDEAYTVAKLNNELIQTY